MSVRGGGLELEVVVPRGRFAVRLPPPVRLRADGFREGNIILELVIHAGESCPRPLVARAYGLEAEAHAGLLDGVMERVVAGELFLLQVLASYGCELVAVFGPGLPEVVQVSPSE